MMRKNKSSLLPEPGGRDFISFNFCSGQRLKEADLTDELKTNLLQ